MKKKEWYELLNKYNLLVVEKKFNEKSFDMEAYFEIREKITHYLNVAYEKATLDKRNYGLLLSNTELNPRIEKYKLSKLKSVIWMKKANKIFASLEAHQLIDKEDMENSYYGTNILKYISEMWPYIAFAASPVVIYILFLLL